MESEDFIERPDSGNHPTYQILISKSDSNAIIANVVYAEVGQEIWGCYSGYAGGNSVDYRFFHFDNDYNLVIEDDYFAFPIREQEDVESVFTRLEAVRATMESEESDLLLLSQPGQRFLSEGEVDKGSGICSRLSEDASEDIIYDIQDEWTLLFRMG